jgi:LPS sulfotransferase NodH
MSGMRFVEPCRLPPRKLVILTTGRAGSELLVSLLTKHPDLLCDGEILWQNPQRFPSLYVQWRAVRATRLGRRASVYGWKVVTNDIWWKRSNIADPVAFLAQFTQPGSLLVTLRRRNLLNQALSFLHADSTQFHFRADEQKKFEPVAVDPEQLLSTIFQYESHDNWLEKTAADLPKLDFLYEDDLASADAQRSTTAQIFEALRLDAAPVQSDLVSVAPSNPLDRVANLDAIRRALAGTRYERFLT